MKTILTTSSVLAAVFAALLLSSCGKGQSQNDGLSKAPDCATSDEQLSAETQLLEQDEVALLKTLRSRIAADAKVEALNELLRKEEDYKKRNGELCREGSGTFRSAQRDEHIVELLQENRQNVLANRPITRGLINALDRNATAREIEERNFERQFAKHLEDKCGFSLAWNSQPKRTYTVSSKERVDAAVKAALSKENSTTQPLEDIIAALNEAVTSLKGDRIALQAEINGGDAEAWTLARDYLETLGNNLANVMKNLETLRKDPKSLAPYWPAE